MTCAAALIMGHIHGHCQELSKSAREALQNQYYEKCLDLGFISNNRQ
jgi:hypothetical protein